MAEGDLHSYACDDSSQESASDSEDFLEGVNGCLFNQERAGRAGVPLYAYSISSPTELTQGDHILYLSSIAPNRPTFRSALVVFTLKDAINLVTYTKEGVRLQEVKFSDLRQVSRVEYTMCRYSRKKTIQRAKGRLKMKEKQYHPLFNNSHFFVSWSKTGKQYPLSVIIQNLLYDEDKHIPLKPVLTRAPLQTLKDLNPGDHLLLGSQHCLVQSVNPEANTLIVYACDSKGAVVLVEKSWNPSTKEGSTDKLYRINYDQQSNFYHSGRALESAKHALEEKIRFKDSSLFVTLVKCGRSYCVDERCLMNEEDEPVSCTKITPHTSIDQGDHLIVKDTFEQMSSLLVHSCLDENVIVTIPDINGKGTVGQLDVTHYREVYRVNYGRCLPIDEVLRRACSNEGEEMLNSCKGNVSAFVSWAKIGKQVSVNASKIITRQQIAQVRPTYYQKILSVEEIQPGDHLFMPNLAYRWHFLVTERGVDPQDPLAFKTIYCLRGVVQETIENLDPDKNEIYRVSYPEEFPTDISIARARSRLKDHKFSPLARLWFVRWAKTGSEEGMEIDFLTNYSMPVSKSSIQCFTQLNPGDYLVKQEKLAFRQHFLVISIESPSTCTVIGNWKGKVEEATLMLDSSSYFLLNYNDGISIPADESIRRAQEAIGQRFIPKFSRRKFVNYMKTTVADEVDVENLPDECLLLKREKVESALELYPGDHIESITLNAVKQTTFHDMIVVNPVDGRNCQVIHKVSTKSVFKGPQLVEETVDIFKFGNDVFRIVYPEQIEPKEGIGELQATIAAGNMPEGLRSDNGRLLTLATVGVPMSLQVDINVHKFLQYSAEDSIKPISLGTKRAAATSGVQLSPAETCTKVASHAVFKLGAHAAITVSRLGLVSGWVPGLNLLIESPFFTRRVYKLYRKHKFDQISDSEYKRGVVKQSFTSANTVIGATSGAIIGQIAIPIPLVGGAVGGALGAVAGHSIGHLEGWAASKLVKDEKIVTLPVIVMYVFSDIPQA